MRKNPWFKFYPSDWRTDPALRLCSVAARGLWVDMLCLMHEGKPRGHLVIKDHAPTDAQLAVLTGIPTDQLSCLIGELENADVFSRTQKGVVYSRRMVADEKRAKIGKKSVERRWSQTTDNKQENPPPIRSPNREPITQKSDTRYQKERKKEEAPLAYAFDGRVIRLSQTDFDRWEKSYPNVNLRSELQARDDWLSQEPGRQANWFIPTSNYLNKRNQSAKPKSETVTTNAWANRVYRWRLGQLPWDDRWGPEPGKPGCSVPTEALELAA